MTKSCNQKYINAPLFSNLKFASTKYLCENSENMQNIETDRKRAENSLNVGILFSEYLFPSHMSDCQRVTIAAEKVNETVCIFIELKLSTEMRNKRYIL